MTNSWFSRFSALLSFAVACASPAREKVSEQPSAVRVKGAIAESRAFLVTQRVSGTVRGHATTTLTSKSVGYLRAVLVRPGDLVREGQVLAELEARDAAAGVAQARAAFSSARANRVEGEGAVQVAKIAAALAKTNFERASNLRRQGVLPQAEFDQAEAALRAATAEETRASARLEAMRSDTERALAALGESRTLLGYSKIIAPFGGRVLERHADPGALASPGTPLLVIADDGRLRVEAAVPESRGARLVLGAAVSVEVDGISAPLSGVVGEVAPNVDLISRAFLIKVDLPGASSAASPELRPGAFARVAFPVATESKLAVPDTAVSRFGALERVFVIERGRAVVRLVTTGESQSGFTPVLSGLSEGERVVREPPAGLRDASAVVEEP